MRYEKDNRKMEVGVKVVVMNPTDKNYGKVGEIIKTRGTNMRVKFGRFNSKEYPAMYLQTVKNWRGI